MGEAAGLLPTAMLPWAGPAVESGGIMDTTLEAPVLGAGKKVEAIVKTVFELEARAGASRGGAA